MAKDSAARIELYVCVCVCVCVYNFICLWICSVSQSSFYYTFSIVHFI